MDSKGVGAFFRQMDMEELFLDDILEMEKAEDIIAHYSHDRAVRQWLHIRRKYAGQMRLVHRMDFVYRDPFEVLNADESQMKRYLKHYIDRIAVYALLREGLSGTAVRILYSV